MSSNIRDGGVTLEVFLLCSIMNVGLQSSWFRIPVALAVCGSSVLETAGFFLSFPIEKGYDAFLFVFITLLLIIHLGIFFFLIKSVCLYTSRYVLGCCPQLDV